MRTWTKDNRTGNTKLENFLASALDLKPLDQSLGNSADFVDADGVRYELKTDKYALRTNSNAFFAEFVETTDNWKTVRKSGILKQAEFADVFLLVCKKDGKYGVRFIPTQLLVKAVNESNTERTTKPFANGNAPGRFSRGKLVNWNNFNDCKFIELPTEIDPLDIKFAPKNFN